MEGGLMDETGLNVTSGQQVLEVAGAKILFLFFFFFGGPICYALLALYFVFPWSLPKSTVSPVFAASCKRHLTL